MGQTQVIMLISRVLLSTEPFISPRANFSTMAKNEVIGGCSPNIGNEHNKEMADQLLWTMFFNMWQIVGVHLL